MLVDRSRPVSPVSSRSGSPVSSRSGSPVSSRSVSPVSSRPASNTDVRENPKDSLADRTGVIAEHGPAPAAPARQTSGTKSARAKKLAWNTLATVLRLSLQESARALEKDGGAKVKNIATVGANAAGAAAKKTADTAQRGANATRSKFAAGLKTYGQAFVAAGKALDRKG